MISSRLRKEILFCVLVFSWPFLFLYKHVIPGLSFSLGTGNDFDNLYYRYKVYLLDHVTHLRYPLWSAGEGAGFPFFSSPFTQAAYPLNLPLAVWYKLNNGFSLYDYQLYTIAGMGIFGVGLYIWLRSLDFNSRISLLTAVIFSTSFKVTELIRFPNAVHTACWMPFLLLGITLAAAKKTQKLAGRVIWLSLMLMLTGGYPYYIYYQLFLAGPYVLFISLKKLAGLLGIKRDIPLSAFIKNLIKPAVLALAVLYPYLYQVINLLQQTTDRAGHSWAYATQHVFYVKDTLGSWIMPPAANTEGWYYFGIIPVFMIILFGLGSVVIYAKNNSYLKFAVLVTTWLGLITYITYGSQSRLFEFLWKYLPGFSALRVWGRLNIILVPVCSWLFAKSLKTIFAGIDFNRRVIKMLSLCLTGVLAITVLYQQKIIADPMYDRYWLSYFQTGAQHFLEERFINFSVAGFILVEIWLWLKYKQRLINRKISGILMAAVLVINYFDLADVGSRQWSYQTTGDNAFYLKKPTGFSLENLALFNQKRIYIYDTLTFTPAVSQSAGYVSNWYYQRYINFLNTQKLFNNFNFDRADSDTLRLLGVQNGQRIFITTKIDYDKPADFLADYDNNFNNGGTVIKPNAYTGNYLNITVVCSQDGYLSYIDNWDAAWTAKTNGKNITIQKLFGTFKSIPLTKGENVVEFQYLPKLI